MSTGFGGLLKRLRTQRGMTQAELGHAVSMSQSTIRNIERSERCIARRSTVTKIFTSLSATAPIEPADAKLYFELAGMTAIVAQARQVAERFVGASERPGISRVTTTPPMTLPLRALRLIESIYREAGEERLIAALDGLAAAMGVTTQARAAGATPSYLQFVVPTRAGDSHQVTLIHPTVPAPSAPRQAAHGA